MEADDRESVDRATVPARMINEYVYCPRLAHLEWVQGEWAESADTVAGAREHRRVDQPKGRLRPPRTEAEDAVDGGHDAAYPPGVGESWKARGVWLTSEHSGLTAKLDLIEGEGGSVRPVESKHGRPPDGGGVWPADRIQVGTQCVILEDLGYHVPSAIVYYRPTKQRIEVTFDERLRADVLSAADAVRALVDQPVPPPLVDSPKCPGCSLVGICLPDETTLLLEHGKDAEESTGRAAVRRLLPSNVDRLPLYIQAAGARVGKNGDELEVTDRDGGRTRVRILDTSQVCLFGNAQVSSQATRELLQLRIPIAWFSAGGWFYGVATPLGMGNGAARHAQHLLVADAARSLEVARGLVQRKIRNCRTLLRRNHPDAPAATLAELQRHAASANEAVSSESLLGIEGAAARAYYAAFSGMLSKGVGREFDWNGRNRRPPTAPLNALLSLGYSLLTRDWTATLFAIGLDPHVGVFHRMRHGKPALALDLMEEFRPLIADSVALQVVNNGEIHEGHFVQRGPACNLTPDGRARYLRAYERRMDHAVTHPIFGYKLTYRQLLEVQARLFARVATGELPSYPGFETR